MSLLRLDASIRVEGSHSRAIADIVEQEWRNAHPGESVLQRRCDPGRLPPLSQLSRRCGDCVERIIRLIGVANYGESDSVNGGREIRPREWREIDHVPPMSYGRARVFKKKHDLGSARCIEIIGDGPYVE